MSPRHPYTMRHERSAAAPTTPLGHRPARGPGGRRARWSILRAADRRPGGAAQHELHQLLQAARPPIPPRSSDDLRLPPRARSGAGNPVIAITPGPWSRPNNSGRSSSASRRTAAGAATTSTVMIPEPLRHQVAEVPPIQPVVDEYRLHRLALPPLPHLDLRAPCRRACPPGRSAPGCGRSSACWPGPTASASDRSANWPPTCSGLSISAGMISRLERQAAAELEAPVEELRQHVRQAASAHIDETSWWQGRDKAWLWAAVTRLVTVFTIATARGAEVAKELLGTDRPEGGHQRSVQELRLDQAAPVLLGASAPGLPGDDRPGRRVGRGRSALAGALRAAVRLVASGAGRDDGPGHASSEVADRCGSRSGTTCARGWRAVAPRRRGRAGSCWRARRTCGRSCESRGSSRRTTTPSGRCGTA